jgi:hypothetical protein
MLGTLLNLPEQNTFQALPYGQVQGRLLGLYSLLHFIFFVTYIRDQLAIVLPYTKLERQARDKHSCMLGQLVIYDENVNTVPCLARK